MRIASWTKDLLFRIPALATQGMTWLVVLTTLLAFLTVHFLVGPGYRSPQSRMSTSRLGYATWLRSTGQSFPVTTTRVARSFVSGRIMGEGLMQSEPVQVPIIVMSHITRVHVKQGDVVRKGQLLIELDPTRVEIKLKACEAALQIALAEYERTRIGSAYILDKERPDRDRILLQQAEEELEMAEALVVRDEKLFRRGTVTQQELFETRKKAVAARTSLKVLKLSFQRATRGREESLRVARSAIREAELAIEHRKNELRNYKIHAPADGIVERLLVHEGEYNQDPGRPAMLLASGLWFNAHMDQTAIGKIAVGDSASVRLEAFPNRSFHGTVTEIDPVVSYGMGGPETNRPIRPLGTGAPEWPATFCVRILIEDEAINLVPGLTGFARVETGKVAVAVPRAALLKISRHKALVYVVEDGGYRPQIVETGEMNSRLVEITGGLQPGQNVIVEGHQILEEKDTIEVVSEQPPEQFRNGKTRSGNRRNGNQSC